MINCFDDKNPYKKHFDDKNLLGINKYDNTIILDLFDTIAYICYTDFYTNRQEDVDNYEKLKISIPVNNLRQFRKIKEPMEKLLIYMTNGEKWTINFVKQSLKKKLERTQTIIENKKFNSIALLSGGLDSLAGACEERENSTLFITYSSNDIENNNAKTIYDTMIKNKKNEHISIRKIKYNQDTHYTERTRSLIFIASCLIYADYYKIPIIKIYENGIMSLNPKFNFSRRTTKTTNQKTLYMINEILKILQINIKVMNPFKYKTKKEIIELIPATFDKTIKNGTRTCSKNPAITHFKNKKIGNFHCGICIACMLRQIGMINIPREDSDYLVPINLYHYKDILNYEKEISKNKNIINDENDAKYKFNEKRSLIEYYISYYKCIKNGTIFNYLDLKKDYYLDDNYLKEVSSMLDRFSKELETYFEKVGVENEKYR